MFNIYEQANIMNREQANIKNANEYVALLQKATLAFARETGYAATFMVVGEGMGPRQDATVRIDFGNRAIDYLAEIRFVTTDAVIARMVHEIHGTERKRIFVTRHVPTHWAKRLKAAGVQFIDTAGNAFVNEPPALIFIQGNRVLEGGRRQVERGIFGLAATKILFALLCKDGLENAPYREIAEAAGVALGGVPATLQGLVQQGFLLELGGGRRKLVKKKDILEKWIAAYIARIHQKTLIGRFTATRDNFWEDIDLGLQGAQWGGEVGANKLTHYLKPEKVTIYTKGPHDQLVAELKLRRDDNGKVELRTQFWNFDFQAEAKNITPVLLIYADLLATPDPRNIETGKIIYDQYLKRHFE